MPPFNQSPVPANDQAPPPWNSVDLLVYPGAAASPYFAALANSDRSVTEALRLRFQVFNLELGEGLAAAALSGLDRDEYDAQMSHLLLVERATDAVVGTYRLQTVRHALAHRGLYSAREFQLDAIAHLFDNAVECGRACIAREHRNFQAVMALWLGLGAYLTAARQRYLFGCCSLTSRDARDGWRALNVLRAGDYLHPVIRLPATPTFSCGRAHDFAPTQLESITLPRLFRAYLAIGATAISEPAIDREFGTVDFLVLLDTERVNFARLDVVVR
ncbi:MAG: GNAT family N-acetyltransferase [Planctomycetota bacterium]